MAKRQTKKSKASTEKKSLRQKPLPGMEPVYHAELDIKSLEYYDALRERQAMQGREEDMKKEIMALLKRYGLHAYESADGIQVTLAEEEKVKVKKKKAPKEEPEEKGPGDEFEG